MTESEKRIIYLLERFENKQATPGELVELDQWYASFEHEPKLTDRVSAEETEEMHRRILQRLDSAASSSGVVKPKSLISLKFGGVSILLLIIGILLIHHPEKVEKVSGLQYDVAAGKNKARLLIPGHQAIDLEKASIGIIYTAPGLVIRKDSMGLISYRRTNSISASSAINKLIIPAGGTFRVNLEDGSKIWLNANSQLYFPAEFSGTERKVGLTGEAYFEVAKNKAKPFLVQTPRQQIQVLGTHFNVNAYTDEQKQKTTLLEGLVQITTLEAQSKTVIIKPGQQAEQNNELIQIKSVDADAAASWKEGLFVFDHTELQELMRQLSRWYNVEIVYQGNPQRRVFSGEIPKNYSLAAVLRILELGSIHFRIEKADDARGLKRLVIIP